MMKRKHIYIAVAAVAIMAIVAIVTVTSVKRHQWKIDESPSEQGDEPYDITLVDELLRRSLPGGYEVRQASVARSYDGRDTTVDAIAFASTDTSLLVIQQYPWMTVGEEVVSVYDMMDSDYDASYYEVEENYEYIPSYAINVIKELAYFCRRGGTALYVPTHYVGYKTVQAYMNGLTGDKTCSFSGEGALSEFPRYSKEWLKARPDSKIELVCGDSVVSLSYRFAVNRYIFDPRWINQKQRYELRVVPLIHEPDSMSRYYPDPDNYSAYDIYAFALEFPRGGRLYVCSLGLHFTNLGVTLGDERWVMEEMMGRIDHQPVARVSYPVLTDDDFVGDGSQPQRSSDGESVHLSVINGNPSLRLAWVLVLAFAACLVFTGLWRRRPVAKAIDVDDLDRTDFVAVREYQFRKSPLLHFLFQTSWLYRGDTDYRQLFLTNYRRVARYAARVTGVDLSAATDASMRHVASVLAVSQGREADDVYSEIKWITELARVVDKVTPRQFARSQRIAEQYPL